MADHGYDEADGTIGSQVAVDHGKLGIDDGISPETRECLQNDNTMIFFQVNPHIRGQKYEIFEKCLCEKQISIGRVRELGGSTWDLKTWFKKSAISIVGSSSISASSVPEHRRPVKNEKLSPKEKMDVLQNRKHKIESATEVSRTLDFSPSGRSPASKQVRFSEATGMSDDTPDLTAVGQAQSSNPRQDVHASNADPNRGKNDDSKSSLSEILSEIRGVNNRLDSMSDSMATKEDMKTMMQQTKELISNAVDPIKDELHEIRSRLSTVESRSKSLVGLDPDIFQMLQQFDGANKQVVFSNFASSISPTDRIRIIDEVMSNFGNFSEYKTGHIFTGPRNQRQISKFSYVEFQSSDIASQFLQAAKNSAHLKIRDCELRLKASLTSVNRKRNWALRKAEEILKANSHANTKIDWKERVVSCKDEIAFKQSKFDLTGTFVDQFSSLSLS